MVLFGVRAAGALVRSGAVTRSFSCSVVALDFKKDIIGVVGLGLMGHGIAQTAATNGYKVRVLETNEESLKTGLGTIQGSLQKIYKKKFENPDEAKANFDITYGRIVPTTHMDDFADCDLIVEAATENLELKHSIFSSLNEVVNPCCIFASNTSSLSITEIGAGTGRPELTVGMHFFNPVQVMKLVEIIEGEKTTEEAYALTHAFVKEIKKIPVKCKDSPGFIVNRLLVPYLAQALALYDRGDATIVDIDNGMKLGAGHPMGPIMLADYVGLDLCVFILDGWIKNHPNEPSFFVPESLRQKVAEGKLGCKSGEGYYKWEGGSPVPM